MRLPKPITTLIDHFERLPGIGPKTAQRLTFYILRFPQEELENFARALTELKSKTKTCSICKNVGEADPCEICSDSSREQTLIAVVSSPLDALAIERAGFNGLYHVLHGVIDPLNNIGPDELYISDLLKRLNNSSAWEQLEVILATNTSMEGESTAMYITKLIRDSGFDSGQVKITRIARGLPVGGDVEYADDSTLQKALDGRSDF